MKNRCPDLANALPVLMAFFSFIYSLGVEALPAFARRENVACVMCHTNGAAPHLTEFGYIYRRMAFHWPGKLGDVKTDEESFNATKHMAVGVNVSYDFNSATNSNGNLVTSKVVNNNGINVNEIEIWPLVGGFLGNWGTWSEIDSVTPSNAGANVQMSLADIRYATGTPDLFVNFRAGMIAPEGYGASDQWLTDANTPLMDHLTANFNQSLASAVITQGGGDTLASPWGAMGNPELGFEMGLNVKSSHFTLGVYNGYVSNYINNDGTVNLSNTSANAGSVPISQSVAAFDNGMRDFRFQYDQFLGTFGAVTLGYYSGAIPLTDPTLNTGTSFSWNDHYTQERVYLTIYAIPEKLDVLLGGGWNENQYVSTQPSPDGKFESKGAFLGLMYYATPHLVLAARADKFYYNTVDSATGYSFQASIPYDNIVWNFHFNGTASTLPSVTGNYVAGQNTDVALTLRFLL